MTKKQPERWFFTSENLTTQEGVATAAAVVARADAMIERYQLRIAAQMDTITRLLAASGAPDSAANEIALLHERLAESRAANQASQD